MKSLIKLVTVCHKSVLNVKSSIVLEEMLSRRIAALRTNESAAIANKYREKAPDRAAQWL